MNSNNSFTIYPSPYNTVSAFSGFQQVWAKKIRFGAQGNKRWSPEKKRGSIKGVAKAIRSSYR